MRPTCFTELLFFAFNFLDGYGGHDHLSPDMYEESETDPGTEDISTRIFVALFDYDPLTMSPNPDAAEEELPFKEGQIIKVGPKSKGNTGPSFTNRVCLESNLCDWSPRGGFAPEVQAVNLAGSGS